MSSLSNNSQVVYPHGYTCFCIRRWIEMVGVLHGMGFGRLRLACSWELAGPSPVWFGDIAPSSYFRTDHGAILSQNPVLDEERDAGPLLPNDVPMLSSRRCKGYERDYPWPNYATGSTVDAAQCWIELYPRLAAEGVGEDEPYIEWYSRMLQATAPTGLIRAYDLRERLPGYMIVANGPAGIDRFELPPPGTGGISDR